MHQAETSQTPMVRMVKPQVRLDNRVCKMVAMVVTLGTAVRVEQAVQSKMVSLEQHQAEEAVVASASDHREIM